jgi:hypothetical protein
MNNCGSIDPRSKTKKRTHRHANPVGNHYLQTQKVRPDGLKSIAPIVNLPEIETGKRS